MRRSSWFLCSLSSALLLALAMPAGAQTATAAELTSSTDVAPLAPRQRLVAAPNRDAVSEAERPETGAAGAAEQGLLLPFAQSPQVYSGYAVAKAIAGYDSAVKDAVARTSAEARVLPILALRLDFDHGPAMGPNDRFGVGARLQLLHQATAGIDGAVGLAYQPNDFREEGHIVGSVLVGRSFGRLRLLGNVLFGGDPEGDDQAGEARASLLYRVAQQLHIGMDSRFRFNASEDEKRAGTLATDWELQATPVASVGFGPVALLAQAGLSMLQTTGPFGATQEKTLVRTGLVAMAGAAGAF